MGKTVVYDEGPLVLKFGEAGEFHIGVPRDIPDYLADVLLRKGLVREVVAPSASTKKMKTKEVT